MHSCRNSQNSLWRGTTFRSVQVSLRLCRGRALGNVSLSVFSWHTMVLWSWIQAYCLTVCLVLYGHGLLVLNGPCEPWLIGLSTERMQLMQCDWRGDCVDCSECTLIGWEKSGVCSKLPMIGGEPLCPRWVNLPSRDRQVARVSCHLRESWALLVWWCV